MSDTMNDTESKPLCPDCSAPMVLRTATSGKYEGRQFWGCSRYNKGCRGIRTLDGDARRGYKRPGAYRPSPRPVAAPAAAIQVQVSDSAKKAREKAERTTRMRDAFRKRLDSIQFYLDASLANLASQACQVARQNDLWLDFARKACWLAVTIDAAKRAATVTLTVGQCQVLAKLPEGIYSLRLPSGNAHLDKMAEWIASAGRTTRIVSPDIQAAVRRLGDRDDAAQRFALLELD